MAAFRSPDWAGVFVPDGSLVESFLRGTVVYFAALVLFRLILHRQTGGLGLTDVLLVVLASECVSPALSAETTSVPNGLAALAALLFWSYALDWATDRWPWLSRRLEHPPAELVRDGEKRPDALHAQHITDDELMSQLRLNGVDDLARVKVATLEPDGEVSVVTVEPSEEKGVRSEERGVGSVSSLLTPHSSLPDGSPDLDEALKRFLAAAGDVRAAAAVRARHGVRPRARQPSPAPEHAA